MKGERTKRRGPPFLNWCVYD